jgi:hypothetical protein
MPVRFHRLEFESCGKRKKTFAVRRSLTAESKLTLHKYSASHVRRLAIGLGLTEKAVIYWGDEMGLRSDHAVGRSYSRRGETPIIPGTGQRRKI